MSTVANVNMLHIGFAQGTTRAALLLAVAQRVKIANDFRARCVHANGVTASEAQHPVFLDPVAWHTSLPVQFFPKLSIAIAGRPARLSQRGLECR